jgi:hypothetical protein
MAILSNIWSKLQEFVYVDDKLVNKVRLHIGIKTERDIMSDNNELEPFRHWFSYQRSVGMYTPGEYYFGNGNSDITGVALRAEGVSPVHVAAPSGNRYIPFIRFDLNNTSSSNRGIINFRCVIMRELDDDYFGQVDITLKFRQGNWHIVAAKCVRGDGAGTTNYGTFGNVVYWQDNANNRVYIGIDNATFNGCTISVLSQRSEPINGSIMNGTATYRIGLFTDNVTSLSVANADTRDLSYPAKTKIADKAAAVVDAGSSSNTVTISYQSEISKITPAASGSTTRSKTKWVMGGYTGGNVEACDAANVTVGAIGGTKNEEMSYEYNPDGISSDSPVDECKTYWSNLANGTGIAKWVYNSQGEEYTMLFSKSNAYGNVIRWGYASPCPEMLRVYSNNWKSGNYWQPICPPYVMTINKSDDVQEVRKKLSRYESVKTFYSHDKTESCIVFLRDGDYYYQLAQKTGGSGQGGSTSVYLFTRPGDEFYSTYGLQFTATTHDYETWECDWIERNTPYTPQYADLYVHDITASSMPDRDTTLLIDKRYSARHYDIRVQHPCTITLDTDSETTIHTILSFSNEGAGNCVTQTLEWLDETLEWREATINVEAPGGSSGVSTRTFNVYIKRVKYEGQYYSIARVYPSGGYGNRVWVNGFT